MPFLLKLFIYFHLQLVKNSFWLIWSFLLWALLNILRRLAIYNLCLFQFISQYFLNYWRFSYPRRRWWNKRRCFLYRLNFSFLSLYLLGWLLNLFLLRKFLGFLFNWSRRWDSTSIFINRRRWRSFDNFFLFDLFRRLINTILTLSFILSSKIIELLTISLNRVLFDYFFLHID